MIEWRNHSHDCPQLTFLLRVGPPRVEATGQRVASGWAARRSPSVGFAHTFLLLSAGAGRPS